MPGENTSIFPILPWFSLQPGRYGSGSGWLGSSQVALPVARNLPCGSSSMPRMLSLEDALIFGTTAAMDRLAERAFANAQGRYSSSNYCLRAVRRALNQTGIDDSSSMGASARAAVPYFQSSAGYIEITGLQGDDIPALPRGTIVLYDHPMNRDLSHAQIMLGWDFAASDYLHDSRVYSGNLVGDVWAFLPSATVDQRVPFNWSAP